MKKIHIEYDDFGEYMEILEDDSEMAGCLKEQRRPLHCLTASRAYSQDLVRDKVHRPFFPAI